MLLLSLVLFFAVPPTAHSQSMADIANIKVDELSDEQIKELVRRANEAGLSESELLQMAQVRGVPATEVEKLRIRLEKLSLTGSGTRSTATASKREPRSQADLNFIAQDILKFQPDFSGVKDEISAVFGSNLFYNKNRRLSFEPNLNMATPKNYVVGPGDMLYIDVYGQSEQYYEATVNPDGFLLLDNIGPVSVSGKTIEESTGIIRNRLSTYYSGLRGANPNTFLQVTLGNVRTIKVHLVGELRLPGTFTLSAFSSVFNALYAAGGPNDNGTMRNIKVIRDGKTVSTIDIYTFLVEGIASLDFQLRDQDVILVEPFISRVSVIGEVKRPKIFEVKENENFDQLLKYAGGFTDEAFRDRINVTRITGKERAVSDIYQNQFAIFSVKGGDQYTVGKVLNRFANRVQIKGAVFREGNYALTEGLTLVQLIRNADGVRGEANLERASILRTNEDLSTEVLSVNLRNILNGSQSDISLQREDVVRVSSIYDLKEEIYVQVTGEVRNPGTYPYSSEMTVEDLIVLAGGLREAANINDIEIARRLVNPEVGAFSELVPVQINADLSLRANPIAMAPFDNLIIRRKPNFTLEKLIQVEGQINSPGVFAVKSAQERISDVIRRAGGLTAFAYPKGATLIRRTEFYETESEQIRRQRNLSDLQQKMLLDPNNTEAQELLLARLFQDLGKTPALDAMETASASQSKRDAITGISETKSNLSPIKIKQTEAVAIDLESILKNPGSEYDLILEEGDIISIPRQLQTVRMRGDVVYPTTVRHESARGMKYYINQSGGFDNRANRKRTYVVYANGEVARTKSFLGLRVFPGVEPGAEVIVPTKGPRIPLRPGELVGISTGLATLLLISSQINW
ncbi:protein involved in polysaccharide export, contains SLBB domain of the beta-grasp fold [Rhodonellum ikkaensis]|uniref:Protein involved in polysaccharide export, contains SLBB domain of the beta-grasp fold n=1 Tax=Rhodonellum ikkaensis TaxID=336829 RepID=A0A1H3LFP4_9BACT|nr:protein involved in polysaccharide export, contains SLBB domain of the beta-grasp fold [Rhodonellum ikkaensis]